ncbi:MAG TPA: hypothetical protein VFT00_04250 [Nocardioides sp.]|nr:hypothetical protein [Nocardioides sp.]
MTDHEEQLLAASLHARADHAAYTRTPVGDVVATARGIQRRQRRRNAALAVAAVVAAITVPTAVVLGTGAERTHDPTGPATSTTPSATPGSSLADLQRGADPRIAYTDGHEFVSPDGTRSPLPVDYPISAITPYHGGFLIADDAELEGTVGLHLFDNEGHQVASWCTSGSPVLSADQLNTAFTTFPCSKIHGQVSSVIRVGIGTGMGDGEATQDTGMPIRLVGMLGERVVFGGMFGAGAWVTDLVNPPEVLPVLTSVADADSASGLVAGQSRDSDGRDGAIVDPDTGRVVATMPGWVLGSFSPDGSLVLGSNPDTGVQVALDTATGDRVATLGPDTGLQVTSAPIWEDDSHVLLAVTSDDEQAIVRADLDGHVELATPVTPGGAPRYVFAARP